MEKIVKVLLIIADNRLADKSARKRKDGGTQLTVIFLGQHINPFQVNVPFLCCHGKSRKSKVSDHCCISISPGNVKMSSFLANIPFLNAFKMRQKTSYFLIFSGGIEKKL